jgi:hypothetical protein
MKRIAALVSIILAVLSTTPARGAKTFASPEECIRNFYTWYVKHLVANRDPMKQRKEIRRFATERLLTEIDKMTKGPDGLNGDYFVDAQDFDPLWAKNITISAVETMGDRSKAHVLLKGSKGMQKKLIVHVAAEDGTWKVDKVQGREGGD